MSNSLEGQDSGDKIMKITFKDKEGKEYSMYSNIEEFKQVVLYDDYRDYIYWRYPHSLLSKFPQYRIPDREGEVDSFENWKLRGCPEPALYEYGELVKKDYKEIKEFLGLI